MSRLALQPADDEALLRRLAFRGDASPRSVATRYGCSLAAIALLFPFFVDDDFVTVLSSAARRLSSADVLRSLHVCAVRKPSSDEILLGLPTRPPTPFGPAADQLPTASVNAWYCERPAGASHGMVYGLRSRSTYGLRLAVPVSVIVLSIVLAVAFTGAGLWKLTGQSAMRDAATHFGIAWERYRLIGVIELAGAAGVLIGFALTALGALAAIGLTLLMIAAIAVHRRAGDPLGQMAPAGVLGVLAAVTAVLYLAH